MLHPHDYKPIWVGAYLTVRGWVAHAYFFAVWRHFLQGTIELDFDAERHKAALWTAAADVGGEGGGGGGDSLEGVEGVAEVAEEGEEGGGEGKEGAASPRRRFSLSGLSKKAGSSLKKASSSAGKIFRRSSPAEIRPASDRLQLTSSVILGVLTLDEKKLFLIFVESLL